MIYSPDIQISFNNKLQTWLLDPSTKLLEGFSPFVQNLRISGNLRSIRPSLPVILNHISSLIVQSPRNNQTLSNQSRSPSLFTSP